ncbi:ATP-dependent exoDNAse beta subunit [Ktedonobacter racemifer DSM 44963]|uniref:ATP-dependent exoDNAse beta subunit n=1 Tax=Ktedonobacter racemifer DSM 44963 TaxID=485913 RepID=D6TW11_KTERA|nr:ATP-dependent exoDNAse beta subunit [Ktedonobacter racemifer DSM 44963]
MVQRFEQASDARWITLPKNILINLEVFSQPFVFVHRSHSFAAFRQGSDGRDATDVTGSVTP